MHLAADGAAVAGGALEEAVGGGLQRQAAQRAAADEHDGLADRLGPDRPCQRRGVRVAQQVGREGGVELERGDELGGGDVRVVAQLEDAQDRPVQDGELCERVDRLEQALLDVGVEGGSARRRTPLRQKPPWPSTCVGHARASLEARMAIRTTPGQGLCGSRAARPAP